jgi:hypothetical protein
MGAARRLALVVVLGAAGCAAKSSSITLPSFDDVDQAPAVIQQAAQAVVLVEMPGFSATGVFISPTGLFLTNNHVLGVGVCPVEGCFAQVTFDYQRGQPVEQPTTIFVVPETVDIGLDIAVLQAFDRQGGQVFSTPSYVTLDSRDPSQLLGTHVNVVGHPEGSIKKWSTGDVVDVDGSWVYTSAFDLPGNSGSPFLDDHGHMVGILHRGADGLDLVTSSGLNDFSLGTASSAIIAALGEPLPGSMVSVAASTTAAQAAAQDLLYLDAQQATATVGGTPQQVIDLLGAACDAALAVTTYASPEDLTAGLEPCYDAENWIQCIQGQAPTSSSATFNVCPADPSAWANRYHQMFEYWLKFNGELELGEVSFAVGALQSSQAEWLTVGGSTLTQALSEAQAPLDLYVAQNLAAFQIPTYEGVNVADYVQNYQSIPDYALNGEELVNAILWLVSSGSLTTSQGKTMLATLHGDPTIDLGTKLAIEQAEYVRGVLP